MIIAIQTLLFFRESFMAALERFLRPYYERFSKLVYHNCFESDSEESEENVCAEYDRQKGVIFFPPVYVQRYAAVIDCLMDERWIEKIEKVVDFGCHDMSFIRYLTDVPGITSILGVDIEAIPLHCFSHLLSTTEYEPKRETPLQITLLQGNAADPDYRLIGCDAVVAIEMIEHMLPHDLERLVHTVFGFIKPQIAIFTTPNRDFNVMFNGLETNGFRRHDHFFEWSRTQFHDWCSNIIKRYPDYTVSCKGIGPGPRGTSHLGCCSQMAMFVAKNYQKQEELNPNSLALVTSDFPPQDVGDLMDDWESLGVTELNMICPANHVESYTEVLISEKHSQITFYIPSKKSSRIIEFQDKAVQCNLDSEFAKSFLMFDYEEMCFKMLFPRKKFDNKVYEIGDVYNSLNCTTLQVTKFSKIARDLVANNQYDNLIHAREVVDEVRRLKKMLNWNKSSLNQGQKDHIWCNINWGYNAPYWNQYYKLVKDYDYPFETKTEECRILDTVFAEMNRLAEGLWLDDYPSTDTIELTIPYIMSLLSHITQDEDKVRELLDWNGYEVKSDRVIYRKPTVPTEHSQEDDWQENESTSDWDSTEFRSTISDGSETRQDYHGRSILRAIDHKLHKLRSMMTSGEDISTELDRAVCRLMKLALQSSKYMCTPPPAKWMQCKLLDLLTLTERAVERRKRHFIENFPLKAIDCDLNVLPGLALKGSEDNEKDDILERYQDLVLSSDKLNTIESPRPKYSPIDMDLEDDLSLSSTELLKEYDYLDKFSPTPEIQESKLNENASNWDDNDFDSNLYSDHDHKYDNSSGDTDHSTNNMRLKYKKARGHKKGNGKTRNINKFDGSRKPSKKSFDGNQRKQDDRKVSSTKITKRVIKKKSSYSCLVKTCSYRDVSMEYGVYTMKIKRSLERKRMTASKPIPKSLIELCHPEATLQKDCDKFQYYQQEVQTQDTITYVDSHDISAIEESCLVDIISMDNTETLALRRTIGTDADVSNDGGIEENERLIRSVSNDAINIVDMCKQVNVNNFDPQTIFISDINEPSTSKGIRHVSLDVQCGPDEISKYCMLSPANSVDGFPTMSTSLKIGDSLCNIHTRSTDCSTSMMDDHCKIMTPKLKNVGIRIQDSDPCLKSKVDSSTITQEENVDLKANDTIAVTPIGATEAKSCKNKLLKSPKPIKKSVRTSDAEITVESTSEANSRSISPDKCLTPKLSYGVVHVHSYREEQGVQDVVFQGEWQKYRTNSRSGSMKTPISNEVKVPIIRKKKVSKEKLTTTKETRKGTEKQELKKPVQVRKVLRPKIKPAVPANSSVAPNKEPKTRKGSKKVTKVASKLTLSSISSKNSKGTYVVKKTDASVKPSTDSEKPALTLRKNYLPLYLRKRLKVEQVLLNENNKCLDGTKEPTGVFQIHKQNVTKLVNKKFLFDLNRDRRERNHFLVYRSENEKHKKPPGTKITESWPGRSTNRSFSPQSQNSSTCSSPNSIATIRVASNKNCTEQPSSSPVLPSPSSEEKKLHTPTSTKPSHTKTNTRKTNKFDNKENVPQGNLNINKNQGKRTFVREKQNVYIAQWKMENSSKQLDKKSSTKQRTINLNTTSVASTTEKQTCDSSETEIKPQDSNLVIQNVCTSSSNLTSIVEPKNKEHLLENAMTPEKIIDRHDMVTDWINSSNMILSPADNITVIRELIDRTLDVIDDSVEGDNIIDSETVVLNQENVNLSGDEILSQTSFTSAVDDERLYTALGSEANNVPTCSFSSALEDEFLSAAGMGVDVNDFDLLSFKSMPSQSDYATVSDVASRIDSMREIFERKDIQVPQKGAGTLASQAFSGFSLNSEPFIGDQPDHVNLIDSETGSLGLEVTRQAASEEMFISGRSSESYESCILDEDAVVPDWLFRMISQQQAISEEPETNDDIVVPFDEPPLAEPLYDANSNITEPVGAGAGAGDGRGIHSDYSQDSSGRGTSLSSSDTSSGVRSETITLDPSTLAVQLEVVGESIVLQDPNETESEQSFNIEGPTNSRRARARRVSDRTTSSDVEADVSSTDTDVPDSDN